MRSLQLITLALLATAARADIVFCDPYTPAGTGGFLTPPIIDPHFVEPIAGHPMCDSPGVDPFSPDIRWYDPLLMSPDHQWLAGIDSDYTGDTLAMLWHSTADPHFWTLFASGFANGNLGLTVTNVDNRGIVDGLGQFIDGDYPNTEA